MSASLLVVVAHHDEGSRPNGDVTVCVHVDCNTGGMSENEPAPPPQPELVKRGLAEAAQITQAVSVATPVAAYLGAKAANTPPPPPPPEPPQVELPSGVERD
jgi:hypothetical protein